MAKFLKRVLRVEGKEVPSLLWTLLFGSFLGVAVALSDLAAVVNFLEHYDNSYIPGAIICSGLLGIFASNTFISIQNWVSYTKAAWLTIFALTLLSLFVYIVPGGKPSLSAIYIAFVLTGPVTCLAMLIFWGLFEKLFDLAQGRRLSLGAEAGMVISAVSVLTFAAVTNISYFKDPFNLYVISFYNLIGAFTALLFISYFYPFLRKVVINVQYIKAYNNYKKLIRQPYTLLLAIFSFLSAIVFTITDAVYLIITNDHFTTQLDTLNFLAGFTAAMLGVGFLLQIFVVRWVNEKYGYLVSLMVLPALLALFTAIYGVLGSFEGYEKEKSVFFFLFMLVCISKLLSVSLFRSLEFSTFKFFFMPLDNLLRSDIQSKIERVIREAGKVLAGLLVVLVFSYFGQVYMPYFLLVFIAIWAFVNYKLNMAYRDKLKISLETREEIEKKEKVATGIVVDLMKAIPETEGKEVEVYLSLLKILDPVLYKDCILSLLEHENEDIQRIALLETSELCLLPAIAVLERIKESKFYPVLKTRDLIDKVYSQLKAAEFRLEKLKYIEQLTLSKLRRERVFGALLAAYSDDSMKPYLLNKLFRDSDGKVRYSAVVSSAHSKSSDLHKNLIEKLGDSYYSNAALSAITATNEQAFPAMENAFYLTGQEEKIQLRIVQAYGRISSETAVQLLLKKLQYTNQNVSRAAFIAVSESGYNITGERVLQFKAELEEYVNVLVWNMSAYLDLKHYKVSEVLLQAMESEIESNYTNLFKLLTLLYDPKTIALIKENIFSSDAEKSEYAFGLVEVTLADEIKPFLLPILTNAPYEEKVLKMQEYFPTESIEKVELLFDLVQRDYKYVNRWTKACALKELAAEEGKIDTDIFVANVINPDSLLKETASVALYLKAPELFPITFERFQRELGTGFSKEVVNKIEKKEVNHSTSEEEVELETPIKTASDAKIDLFAAPNLKFEMIKFFNGIEEFKYVPGIVLMELARTTEFLKFKKDQPIAIYESPDTMDYFFVRSGRVLILKNNKIFHTIGMNGMIHNYYLMTEHEEPIQLIAEGNCEVYKIKQEDFNEVMSFNEEIPYSIYRTALKKKFNVTEPAMAELS